MGFIGYFFVIYFGSIFLKAIGAPGFKEIGWGWFILAPIFVPIGYVLWKVIQFCFYVAVGLGGMWLIAKIILFMTS